MKRFVIYAVILLCLTGSAIGSLDMGLDLDINATPEDAPPDQAFVDSEGNHFVDADGKYFRGATP
jgi:hypothetical protein